MFPWKFFHNPLPNSFIWLGARAKRDASREGRVSQKENFEHNRSKQLFGGIRKSYEEDYTEKEEEKEEKTKHHFSLQIVNIVMANWYADDVIRELHNSLLQSMLFWKPNFNLVLAIKAFFSFF